MIPKAIYLEKIDVKLLRCIFSVQRALERALL